MSFPFGSLKGPGKDTPKFALGRNRAPSPELSHAFRPGKDTTPKFDLGARAPAPELSERPGLPQPSGPQGPGHAFYHALSSRGPARSPELQSPIQRAGGKTEKGEGCFFVFSGWVLKTLCPQNRICGGGSNLGTQNGTLVNRNMDQAGLILTHTHVSQNFLKSNSSE